MLRSSSQRQAAGWLACLLVSSSALAQDRPNEADMFGGGSAPAEAGAGTTEPAAVGGTPPTNEAQEAGADRVAPAAAATTSRDDAVLGATGKPMFTEEAAPEDPLTIGGQLYLRTLVGGRDGANVKDYSLNMPTLLDVFFDVRPNDRVRGFVLGRMSYDPLLPAAGGGASLGANTDSTGTSGAGSLASLFGTAQQTNAPRVLLDQLWLRFDVGHKVFVTAGRQHVRWGTAHFWTPTDFLHLTKRNPLDVFDARTGTTMVKLHLPIESESWNFYAYGVTEGRDGAPTLSTPAGALRAELLLGPVELGLGVFGRPRSRAKFAADASMPVGDVDVYAEVAVVDPRDSDRVDFDPTVKRPEMPMVQPWQTQQQAGLTYLNQLTDAYYPVYRKRGYHAQAAIGASYTGKYNDNDNYMINAEYFYNSLGYDSPNFYSGLVYPHTNALQNPAPFFYLGKHYAALAITFPAPFKLDLHTFTLSTLGNLSDRSFITRLDYSYALLTHLRLEAYGAVHYGNAGEFRFTPFAPVDLGPAFRYAPLFDLGVGLRLAI